MDIEKDSNREAFEAIAENIRLLRGAKFKDGEYVALSLFDESSKELAAQLNYGWAMWLSAKAKSEKALLEQFEINNKLVEQIEKLKAKAMPEGFVVVPRKATKVMLDAGYEAHDGFFTNGAVQDVYVAMIEAQEQK